MCQITHLGRRGEPYQGHWLPTIGPSAIRETLHRSFLKEMDDHDIARVVRAYGAAARRCKEGGCRLRRAAPLPCDVVDY